jgi:hypothetical protein
LIFLTKNSIALYKEGFPMKIRKIITKGLLATSILGVAATLSNTAYTASGNVFDGNEREIVGMWVEVKGGTSGWASLTSINGAKHNKRWAYNTQGKSYQVHVGIEGTPK